MTECIKENSGGKFLINGQILPHVQETISNCVKELPYGQMMELWKTFIETFSTLEIMNEVFMVNKCKIFISSVFRFKLMNLYMYF